MTNLCIDIGNTFTKIAVFTGATMDHFEVIKTNVHERLSTVIQDKKIEKVIVSSVAAYPDDLDKLFKELNVQYMVLDANTPLPIENCYESKDTLGKDRIAAAVGAHSLFPNADLLVIDAGTAITYEFINKHGQYLGGNIAPGMQMRFKALNAFTHKLPLVEPQTDYPVWGRNTNEAIRVGVQSGIIHEVDGTIEGFKNIYPHLQVILTGGDIKFFDNKLKNAIFVVSNLLMIGLNRILTYNAQDI
jgi:type III pantothenate kinase